MCSFLPVPIHAPVRACLPAFPLADCKDLILTQSIPARMPNRDYSTCLNLDVVIHKLDHAAMCLTCSIARSWHIGGEDRHP